jgi:hypothetical protein
MNRFRPQNISTKYIMKHRLLSGRSENYNWQTRIEWYPAGWKTNQISIARRFGHLHYLACHSPEPIRKKWSSAYNVFCNRYFANKGNASMRYLNTWTSYSWL